MPGKQDNIFKQPKQPKPIVQQQPAPAHKDVVLRKGPWQRTTRFAPLVKQGRPDPNPYKPTYYENPQNVAREWNKLQTLPKGSQPPDWLDVNKLNEAYTYFKYANSDAPWTEWKYLHPDDDLGRGLMQSMGTPPSPEMSPQYAAMYSNLDSVFKGEASWSSLAPDVRASTLADPNFDISNYPWEMRPEILSDANFDWSRVPAWQKAAFYATSNPNSGWSKVIPTIMGAIPAAVIGSAIAPGPGTAIGAVVGGIAGYRAASGDYDMSQNAFNQPTFIGGVFAGLNVAAEEVEKTLGLITQLGMAAAIPDHRKDFQSIQDLFTAYEAGLGFYEQIPATYLGKDIIIGRKDPIAVQDPGRYFVSARERIENGENYRMVAMEAQQYLGAQGTDFAMQMFGDPLNLLPYAQKTVGGKILDATGHPTAAAAMRDSSGLIEGIKTYGSRVQTGEVKPGFSYSEMTGLERSLAGITVGAEGKPVVRAGKFAGSGILEQPKKGFINYLTTLTPESRARVGLGMASENIIAMMSMFDTPEQVHEFWTQLRGGDYSQAAEMGARFLESPEHYTIMPAIKNYTMDEMMALWSASRVNADVVERIAQVLKRTGQDVINDLATPTKAAQTFEILRSKLNTMNDQAAQLLKNEIAAGTFTADDLVQAGKIFNGESKAPLTVQQWKAMTGDAMTTHFENWAVDFFKLEPASPFFRAAHMLKSAQSLLLLGFNPKYLVNNVINNMVSRIATGNFGYMTPNQIAAFIDDFGIMPSRLKEGVGMVGEVHVGGAVGNIITNALRETKGKIATADRVLKATGNKIGIMSNLSRFSEMVEGANAYTIGIKRAYNKLWKVGKGISRMDRALETAINNVYPGASELIYRAVEAGMNQKHIETIVSQGVREIHAKSLVDIVARSQGVDPVQAATMMDEQGVLRYLDEGLKNAKSERQVREVFRRAGQKAQDAIDLRMADNFKTRAQSVTNQLKHEGFKAVDDIYLGAEMMLQEQWLKHYSAFEDAIASMDLIEDPIQRSLIWDNVYRQNIKEWNRVNASQLSSYKGLAEALGMGETPAARNFLARMAEIHKLWNDAYQFRMDLTSAHTDKYRADWDNPMRRDDWGGIQQEIHQKFEQTYQDVKLKEQGMGQIFADQFNQAHGQGIGDLAGVYWKEIMDFREKMWTEMQNFRSSMRNMTAEQRKAAAAGFWHDRYPALINEFENKKMNGAMEIDRTVQGRPTPPPTEPTQPGTPAVEPIAPVEPPKADVLTVVNEYGGVEGAAIKSVEELSGRSDLIAEAYRRRRMATEEPAPAPFTPEVEPVKTDAQVEIERQATEMAELLDFHLSEIHRLPLKDIVAPLRDPMRFVLDAMKTEAAGTSKSLLDDIKAWGGINIKYIGDATLEKRTGNLRKYGPGLVTKKGLALDQLAVRMAEEGYITMREIDPNHPDSVVNKIADMIQEEMAGNKIYLDEAFDEQGNLIYPEITPDWYKNLSITGKDKRIKTQKLFDEILNSRDAASYGTEPAAAERSIKKEAFDRVIYSIDEYPGLKEKIGLDKFYDYEGWLKSVQEIDNIVKSVDINDPFADTTINFQKIVELAGSLPKKAEGWTTADGETYTQLISRVWDDAEAKLKEAKPAQEEHTMLETLVKADKVEAQLEAHADALMTRNVFEEQLIETFGLAGAHAEAIVHLMDAQAEAWSKWTGKTVDQWWSENISGIVRGGEGELFQGDMRLEASNGRMSPEQIVNYARSLVRAGTDELRRAIQNEPNQADRIALIDAAYKIDKRMAETVALQARMLFQGGQYADVFYSKLGKTIADKMANRMDNAALRNMLNGQGIKPDEMKWTGMDDFLDEHKGMVTKEEVQQFIRENQVEVKVVTKGPVSQDVKFRKDAFGHTHLPGYDKYSIIEVVQGYALIDKAGEVIDGFPNENSARNELLRRFNEEGGPTKFGQYVEPGGSNYREVLMTLPKKTRTTLPEGARISIMETSDALGEGYDAYVIQGNGPAERFGHGVTPEIATIYAIVNFNSRGANVRDFTSSHWAEPNVLSHFRLNDRVDADGKRVLFVEEIQSDWHQAGREKGYAGPRMTEAEVTELGNIRSEYNLHGEPLRWKKMPADVETRYNELMHKYEVDTKQINAVPTAPFSKTWPELSMKRIIRMAAEEGYDKVAWTTGEMQAARYNLIKQVDSIEWVRNAPDDYDIWLIKNGSKQLTYDANIPNHMTADEMSRTIGKDITERIVSNTKDKGLLVGAEQLSVGGEGMKGFYDKILPETVNKYIKKWGGRVGETNIKTELAGYDKATRTRIVPDGNEFALEFYYPDTGEWNAAEWYPTVTEAAKAIDTIEQTRRVQSFDITPEMRRSVLYDGQPLFQGKKGAISWNDDMQAIIHAFDGADFSTAVHEIGGHMFPEILRRAADEALPQYRAQLQADVRTLEDWAGVKDGVWGVPEREKLARGFERYIAEGKAPTPALFQVFERMKTWMLEMYKAITGSDIDIDLTDDVRAVFDRMLGQEQEAAAVARETARAPQIERPMPDVNDPLFTQKNTLRQLQNALDGDNAPSGAPWYRDPETRLAYTRNVDDLIKEIQAEEQTPPVTTKGQGTFFPDGEDTPLEEVRLTPQVTEAEIKAKAQQIADAKNPQPFKIGDRVIIDGQELEVNYIKGGGQLMLDDPKTGDRVWSNVHPDNVTRALEPAAPIITRESTLFNDLIIAPDFAKSRDFEAYIKERGFDLNNEADIALAYDILEGSFNMRLRDIRAAFDRVGTPFVDRLIVLAEQESRLTEARRTLGKMKAQQFSTPVTISEAAGYVADVRPGDTLGEPTAGTANLVEKFAGQPDVKIRVNEFDPARRQVLEMLGYDPTSMDLMSPDWLMEGGKLRGPYADVMIVNPPWGSYSTGKYGKATSVPVKLNDWSQRFTYLMMMRLSKDGRFVGVMPTNWLYTMDRKTRLITNKPSEFYKWLKNNTTVQAVIESPPDAYKNRGTDIGSLLIVIDRTQRALDAPPIEAFGDKAPADWAEYATLVESVPKRTQEAVAHGQDQLRKVIAGPDASGIIDPNARAGIPTPAIERIGEPTENIDRGAAGRMGDGGDGTRLGTGYTEPAGPGVIAEPGTAVQPGQQEGTGTPVVEGQPGAVRQRVQPREYSDAYKERLAIGRATVKQSRTFTEYVDRAPFQPDDIVHHHPSTVVETKALSGVPYPPLEEAYRPSPMVMEAMNRRALSSEGNINPIWQAIQMNDKHHMGILIADDVGMGKSRTAAGFVLDRIERGKKRILVVTKDEQNVLNLMNEEFPQVYAGVADENGGFTGKAPFYYPAERVFLSGHNFPEVKKGNADIPTFEKPAVYFMTTSEFMYFEEQLKTLRPDVVIVDEAHNFKNVTSQGNKRKVAWINLHEDWLRRKVDMMYLTATPGMDIADLQYLYGLKVWSMDGFGDWVKVITGEISPEKAKSDAVARANIEQWVAKVQDAVSSIVTKSEKITNTYGDEFSGRRVGRVTTYAAESWHGKEYNISVNDIHMRLDTTTETQAILLSSMIDDYIKADRLTDVSARQLATYVDAAHSEYSEKFPAPQRNDMQVVGIKDASDIIAKSEKGGWGKKAGPGAFESTLPPAHTEQIMRELKVAGSYMARDISRAGVDFNIVEVKVSPEAMAAHNKRIQIYKRIHEAWKEFGAMNEGPKKAAALYGLSGDFQADAKRSLFNMRLPQVIDEANKAIANGEQVVISIVSVGEVDGETGNLFSSTTKINTNAVHKIGDGQYSSPTEIPEALVRVMEIREDLKDLPVLPSPIEVFRDTWGDKVAFVTGDVSTKDRMAAQNAFQHNKLDVIVISGAGKTGINLHDITGKKRVHLIEADYEWSATTMKQGLGRVDRTGQVSSPKVDVVHSGSAAERKFIATISNRMEGIGVTSKGGSGSTGTSAMTDMFELGTTMDKIALDAAWQELPREKKNLFIDRFFDDPNVKDGPRSTLPTDADTLKKWLLALQTIDIEEANQIFDAYLKKREEMINAGGDQEEMLSTKTAKNTGEIIRQEELGDNLRLSEVRDLDGSKFAVLDGVLTPHMNAVKGVVTSGADIAMRFSGDGKAWMRWVQFYDPEKNMYVSGLRVKPSKIKDLGEYFGKKIGSMHKPETALVDLRAGDKIPLIGANMSEWELYFGKGGSREGKIVIDQARMKDKDVLMNNGASYNSIGNFFFVSEDTLQAFIKRFPIKNDAPPPEKPPMLYQEGPILPVDPRVNSGDFARAESLTPEADMLNEGYTSFMKPLLSGMEEEAVKQFKAPKFEASQLPADAQASLGKYLNQKKGEMATSKLASVRYGEGMRDFAMLNYNRRYGFDKYLDVVAPYQFWYTRTMLNWAMRGLDKPAFYSNYARLNMMQNKYQNDLPERFRGKISIPAPWLPDWMGNELFIDPKRAIFPFANMLTPFETMARDNNYQMIETERILQEWAQDETYSQTQIADAATTRSGAVWEKAVAEAAIRREKQIANPMDFMSALLGPAWYLSMPAKALGLDIPYINPKGGGPETISELPLTSSSRAIKAVTQGTWLEPIGQLIGLMGKPEEWIRNKTGMPQYGEYGDYYVKRQISNMVVEGEISVDEAKQAMIEGKGEIYDAARQRVELELAMRIPGAAATYAALNEGIGAGAAAIAPSIFGGQILPKGELEYRGQAKEWNQAWEMTDKLSADLGGDQAAIDEWIKEHPGDDFIGNFFNKYPEYEAYLAKNKDEGELLRNFLTGQIWDNYMALSSEDRRIKTAQMPDLFKQSFLDKETRSYDSIDTETLAMWARIFKADVPETPATQEVIDTPQYQMPDILGMPAPLQQAMDEYNLSKQQTFPGINDIQSIYFAVPETRRRKVLLAYPQLASYWDWRRAYLDKHPEVAQFMDQEFQTAILNNEANPVGMDAATAQKLLRYYKSDFVGDPVRTYDSYFADVSPTLKTQFTGYVLKGTAMGDGAYKELRLVWENAGKPQGNMDNWIKRVLIPTMP